MIFPEADIDCRPCWRIIPSRFPPIDLFERVADPEDLDAVFEIEALTNPRIRQEIGELSLVPPEDRVSGPGSSAIMAAFTHPNPEGSRFSDGGYGVYYAANTVETAIAETKHHREKFLRATNEDPIEVDMRVYLADLIATLCDIRGQGKSRPDLYHPTDYGPPQGFAKQIRDKGSDGIVYDSVRREGGECVAVFRPRLLGKARQERHLCYVWDGREITAIYEKSALGTNG